MSEAYLKRLLDEQFRSLDKLKWYETAFFWITDSSYRKHVQLDKFLKEQLANPSAKLLKLAKSLRGSNPYQAIYNIEKYVIQKYTYKTDKEQYGKDEYWASVEEMLSNYRGDCEDQNLLIWVLCRLAGIDKHAIYSVLGETSGGYHYWVLFWDARRARFVKLDATFYPLIEQVAQKEKFKLSSSTQKGYRTADVIFNEEGAWRG